MKTVMRTPAAVLLSVLAVVPLPAQPAPPFGDRASFETFVDGVMAGEMEAAHVPGAVVVVVRNGTVFFSKGYGYADLEARTPVLPERTIFRIGSITKVFTALAVMQLADRGKLELSDDVNRHLRTWKVPATYAQPITIANLLTHSSGLDEISPGRKTGDPKNLIPLGEFLSTRIVRRRAPGTMISYSTYNMALAGHVVESITGTHLRDYFAANIFTPLAMTRTTLGALPAAQRGDLATGYEFSHGRYKPLPFEYFHTYPASDINSTGADMGRFMLSQLGGGALGETRIVSEAATRQMQSRQFANHPRLIGMTYGWFENRRGGLAAIEHGGVMDGYSSLVYLAPRENFGIYVAGTIEDSNFPIAVRNAIVGRDFHAPQTEVPAVTPPLKTRLTRFAGSYRNDIWCHSCPALSRGFLPVAGEGDGEPGRHDFAVGRALDADRADAVPPHVRAARHRRDDGRFPPGWGGPHHPFLQRRVVAREGRPAARRSRAAGKIARLRRPLRARAGTLPDGHAEGRAPRCGDVRRAVSGAGPVERDGVHGGRCRRAGDVQQKRFDPSLRRTRDARDETAARVVGAIGFVRNAHCRRRSGGLGAHVRRGAR
jgi:CubicO group peptidase (beta-lactamase class C family)